MMKPEQFLADFVAPLVEGGQCHVGPPLGQVGLARLLDAKPEASVNARITDARWAAAQGLQLDPIPPRLDVASLRLAVAVHDLLFLLHPQAAGPLVRDKRMALVAEHAAAIARLPLTRDTDELVARHTLLHLFPTLGRTDVRVSFWVGKREFHGAEPPKRLTAWPSVRGVREERWRSSCFSEAASHSLGGAVVKALYEGSPLTDLLHPIRIEPRFVLGRIADVLTSTETCRLVAYQLLDQGVASVGATLAQATLAELDGNALDRARFVLAFIAHLHLCQLLAPAPGGVGAKRAEMTRLTSGGDAQLRDYYGLYAAIARVAPELAAPADVRRDRRLAPLLEEHAASCEVTCGSPRVAQLATLVARGIGRAVAAPAEA